VKQKVAALVCGGLAGLAFPEADAWWLIPFALAGAIAIAAAADSARTAAVRAWFAGVGYFLVAAHWLVPNVGPGLVAIAGLLALTWMPWGAVAFYSLRPPLTPVRVAIAMLVIPAAFVAGEYVRSWEYLGGPWALTGASQWSTDWLIGLASFGGVWLLSFVGIAVATAVSVPALPTPTPLLRIGSALAATVIVLGGAIVAGLTPGVQRAGSLEIAGVQPGPDLGAEERLEAALSATERLGPTDLVVWGESSVGFDLRVPEVVTRTEASATAASAPILANFDARAGSRGIYKSSILIDASGVSGRYDKLRLVPFGEYIPLRPLLGWLGGISEAANEDRRRGEEPTLLDVGVATIGTLVCFESTFPDMARRLADMGADVIVVQSATSSFQESWAPEQHASLAAIRAVESGRTVVHATLTGVSAAFDPTGARLLWVPTDRRGTYFVDAPISTTITPYVRFGDWVPLACLGVLGLWSLVTIVRARARSQNSATVSPTDTPRRAVDPRTSTES
jgi:apolipoprotein N-acyltransferase